jgi:hypothetical protein
MRERTWEVFLSFLRTAPCLGRVLPSRHFAGIHARHYTMGVQCFTVLPFRYFAGSTPVTTPWATRSHVRSRPSTFPARRASLRDAM